MGNYKFAGCYTLFGQCFEFLAGIFPALKLRSVLLRNHYSHIFTLLVLFLISICLIFSVFLGEDSKVFVVNNIILAIAIFYGLLTEQSLVKKMLTSRQLQLLGKSS